MTPEQYERTIENLTVQRDAANNRASRVLDRMCELDEHIETAQTRLYRLNQKLERATQDAEDWKKQYRTAASQRSAAHALVNEIEEAYRRAPDTIVGYIELYQHLRSLFDSE